MCIDVYLINRETARGVRESAGYDRHVYKYMYISCKGEQREEIGSRLGIAVMGIYIYIYIYIYSYMYVSFKGKPREEIGSRVGIADMGIAYIYMYIYT